MTLFEALEKIEPLDKSAMEKSYDKWLNLVKPLFSLGSLENAVTRIAGIIGSERVVLDKKAVAVMCSDNGVVEEGVSQSGQEITAEVTANLIKGRTSVCKMAEIAGADVFPIDIGVAVDICGVTDEKYKIMYGTNNITNGAAMTREQAVRAIEVGIEKVRELKALGYKIIATGEMGIGNTTTASAVVSVLLNKLPEEVTGRGAGLSSEGLERKINAIKKAVAVNKPDKNDAIDVLSKVGGLDIAGMAGLFIGGAVYRIPIVIDGFISAAAALTAVRMNAMIKDYIFSSHRSNEPAGKMVLDALGFEPYITCGMFLGEGTGAVSLFPLLDMALSVYDKMHTFDSWNYDAYKILN